MRILEIFLGVLIVLAVFMLFVVMPYSVYSRVTAKTSSCEARGMEYQFITDYCIAGDGTAHDPIIRPRNSIKSP